MAETTRYTISALAKGLKVLEALEGTNFEPVTVQRVADRTREKYDYCYRALKTFETRGYARETERGWQIGPRILRFSERLGEAAAVKTDSQI